MAARSINGFGSHVERSPTRLGPLPVLTPFLMVLVMCSQSGAADSDTDARQALQRFIDAWNTGDDTQLRDTMHFPFISLFGAQACRIAETPDDFSAGFDSMRQREGWSRSRFDFDTFETFLTAADKVHCAIDYERFDDSGRRYQRGRVMYVVTKVDDRWGIQMRTQGGPPQPLTAAERESAVEQARGAALRYMTAFNRSNASASSRELNYPHVFMIGLGRVAIAETDSDPSAQVNFGRMKERENWHFSSFDSIEPSIVTNNKVHLEVVFSRWHPDGTRYLTVPALWIATRDGDHWGIQLRSLMGSIR